MLGAPEENERNTACEKWLLREETAFLGRGRGPDRAVKGSPWVWAPWPCGKEEGREEEVPGEEVHRRKCWRGSVGRRKGQRRKYGEGEVHRRKCWRGSVGEEVLEGE